MQQIKAKDHLPGIIQRTVANNYLARVSQCLGQGDWFTVKPESHPQMDMKQLTKSDVPLKSLIITYVDKHRCKKSEGTNKNAAQRKKTIHKEVKIVGNFDFFLSERSGSRGRHMSVNIRPASITQRVQRQPGGLHFKTLSHKR